jgi:hypothetical protein
MRTRLSICRRKQRFASAAEAVRAADASGLPLLPYRCDRCGQFHLTSRTRGKFMSRGALTIR